MAEEERRAERGHRCVGANTIRGRWCGDGCLCSGLERAAVYSLRKLFVKVVLRRITP